MPNSANYTNYQKSTAHIVNFMALCWRCVWSEYRCRCCALVEKKISHRQLGPLRGSSSPFQHFEPARVKPIIKLPYSPSPPDNGLGQYASSPGNRAYCYAELAVFSLAMAVIIASTHFAYPRRDGQAELAWVASYMQRWFTRF